VSLEAELLLEANVEQLDGEVYVFDFRTRM
jgi:hypothetical protein